MSRETSELIIYRWFCLIYIHIHIHIHIYNLCNIDDFKSLSVTLTALYGCSSLMKISSHCHNLSENALFTIYLVYRETKTNLTMSFTKIPNFSNCNIWLPQQQLNIVMKYYHTRVKITSFLNFSLLFFLVKCLLYNKVFFFNNTSRFYNYAHYCNMWSCLCNEKARKTH